MKFYLTHSHTQFFNHAKDPIMNIQLNGPVTITLQPNTMAMILDVLAQHVPYNVGKQVIEGEIFPQLVSKEKRDGDGNMDSAGGVCAQSGDSSSSD